MSCDSLSLRRTGSPPTVADLATQSTARSPVRIIVGSGDAGMASSGEPLARPVPRLHRLDLAVARRARGGKIMQQATRHVGDLVDGALERRLVGFRGVREAGELAHELERRGADFLLGRRRIEIEQGADVAA